LVRVLAVAAEEDLAVEPVLAEQALVVDLVEDPDLVPVLAEPEVEVVQAVREAQEAAVPVLAEDFLFNFFLTFEFIF
jgi:hypothetical protein